MLTAKQIMSENVVIVSADLGIRELANLLNEKMITGAPVVDDEGKLIGVVSSMDIVRHIGYREENLATERNTHPAFYVRALDEALDFEELRRFHIEEYDDVGSVADIMTTVVFGVQEDTPVQEIAAMMVRGRIHRVIVTRDRRVIGIVSSLDVLRALTDGV